MSADSSSLHIPGMPSPPTPDEKERAAIHCAGQLAEGKATREEFDESLHMLGVWEEATALTARRKLARARNAAAHAEKAQILSVRSPRKRPA